MRIEPPMSLPWATGTMRDATAAPDPPLEPPVLCSGFQGLRAGPWASGSVVGAAVSSGTFVRPRITNPAARYRRTSSVSAGERCSRSRRKRMPCWYRSPAECWTPSFTSIGTPRNGPSGSAPRASARARSKRVSTSAPSSGSSASMRVIAASTRSSGDASPRRTRPAWSIASSDVSSTVSPFMLPALGAARRPLGPRSAARRDTGSRPLAHACVVSSPTIARIRSRTVSSNDARCASTTASHSSPCS